MTNSGRVAGIVEHRDATPEQLAINEVNTSVYAFDAAALRDALGKLTAANDQGEEYLTDVLDLLASTGRPVAAHELSDPEEGLGANDRAQLAALAARLRDRINTDLMRSGVSMLDPATTWIDVTVRVEPDATIEPNTQLRGATSVAAGAVVGPDTTLTNVVVGGGAQVIRTHGSDSVIGAGASVGPFAYLRPDTELADSGKIGTFVETKNARIGEGSKVPHLSYVGDATIGRDVNIGAATIFVNYDGMPQAPHDRRGRGVRRLRHDSGRAGHGACRRLHRRRQLDQRGRAVRRARHRAGAATQHRRMGRTQTAGHQGGEGGGRGGQLGGRRARGRACRGQHGNGGSGRGQRGRGGHRCDRVG